ncbi:MAG: phosphomethylpyrimidine synthase ThiC [Halobacteriota archaeon]|nr:phosphomethylpyrimidine synthase ThiC [Halobacteriota archaeon]
MSMGINDEIESVAKIEGVDPGKLEKLIRNGRVVIPKNAGRDINPVGVGESLSTKINANIGSSRDFVDINEEIEKAKIAVKYGADTVMDLSTGGDLDAVRRMLLKELDVPVGTVPIYQAGLGEKAVVDMSPDDMFDSVRRHAKDGVDFVTIHAGVNLNTLERLKKSGRILNVVSRGGCFTIAWMAHNETENPFYAEFDYLLELAKEFDLTLSLGDGMRPGCLADATDRPKFMEFIVLGELVKRARDAGVKAFVEGPGHVPLDEIGVGIQSMKYLTDNAPLYLLGPVVSDIAPGYDHITGAIGGSVAGMHGADFLCMTTPSEHLALPSRDDIKEGTIVTKIAAHVADTVKMGQREAARKTDFKMALARRDLDWDEQFNLAIDSEKARRMKESRNSESDACSMCGDLCAIKIVKEVLDG